MELKNNSKDNLNNNLMSKQTIYWDVDDVILNTSEVAVEIINNKYADK